MLAAASFHAYCAVALQRLCCLSVIEVGNRYVHILGVTAHPTTRGPPPQIRSLLMDLGEHEADCRFQIRDRAGRFTGSSGIVLASAGIRAIMTPPQNPRANAFAERFVLTARTEVTHPMLILGERHLRTVLAQYRATAANVGPTAAASCTRRDPITPPLTSREGGRAWLQEPTGVTAVIRSAGSAG